MVARRMAIERAPRRARGRSNHRRDAPRGFRFVGTAVGLLLVVVARVVVAGGAVAPDAAQAVIATAPAGVAVTLDRSPAVDASVPRAATGESLGAAHAQVAPSAAALALLRSQVGRQPVRVSAGGDAYEFRHAGFGAAGVEFSTGHDDDLPLWANADARPASSPIPWERIDAVRVQHSQVRACALLGAVVGAALVIGVWRHSRDDLGLALIDDAIVAPLAAIGGAATGAVAGALATTWPVVWRRAPAVGR
jgi:hypothetical protein